MRTQEPQIAAAKHDSSSAGTAEDKRLTKGEVRTMKRVAKAIRNLKAAAASGQQRGQSSPTGRRLLQAAPAAPARVEKRSASGVGAAIRRAEHRFFQEMQQAAQGASGGAAPASSAGGRRARSKLGTSKRRRAGQRELLAEGLQRPIWQGAAPGGADADDALSQVAPPAPIWL